MNYLTPNLATQREILISPVQEDDKDLHRSFVDGCRTDEFEEDRSLELIQQRSVAIRVSSEPALRHPPERQVKGTRIHRLADNAWRAVLLAINK